MTPIRDYKPTHPVAEQLKAAIRSVSPVKNTRDAYWVDVRHWLQFCEMQKVNPSFVSATAKKDRGKRDALLTAVGAWMDAMREDVASKTRTRRIGTLSSLHGELARRDADLFNPFSVAVGPRREKALRERPTPLVEPQAVARLLSACEVDKSLDGRRDEALLRILWATGIRESEAASLSCERLARYLVDGRVVYLAEVKGKGGKFRKVFVRGRAAEALKKYLAARTEGFVFLRASKTPITRRDVWLIVDRRRREAGVSAKFSPHSFRASFLTYNGAGLEAKQSAAGHVDAATTAMYDREEWRGKEAFEKMPEVEDMVRDESEDT